MAAMLHQETSKAKVDLIFPLLSCAGSSMSHTFDRHLSVRLTQSAGIRTIESHLLFFFGMSLMYDVVLPSGNGADALLLALAQPSKYYVILRFGVRS
jgi:hypothetical protein